MKRIANSKSQKGLALSCRCRQGAHLLKKILQQLGAQSELVSEATERAHGRFLENKERIQWLWRLFKGGIGKDHENGYCFTVSRGGDKVLMLGHYDVQPAEEADWETDPWSLSGRNGWVTVRARLIVDICMAVGSAITRDRSSL